MDKILDNIGLRKTTRYGTYFSLLIVSIALLFYQHFPKLIMDGSETNIYKALGILIGGMIALMRIFEYKLDKIAENQIKAIRVGEHGSNLASIYKEEETFTTALIYANTSSNIYTVIKESGIKVDLCKIILRREENNNQYKIILENNLDKWKKLNNKFYTNLEYRFYDFTPTECQIIFDDKYMITGLNVPDDTLQKVDLLPNTFLIKSVNRDSKIMIQKYIERYEKLWDSLSL